MTLRMLNVNPLWSVVMLNAIATWLRSVVFNHSTRSMKHLPLIYAPAHRWAFKQRRSQKGAAQEEASVSHVVAWAHATLQCSLELGSGNRGEREMRAWGSGFTSKSHGGFCQNNTDQKFSLLHSLLISYMNVCNIHLLIIIRLHVYC